MSHTPFKMKGWSPFSQLTDPPTTGTENAEEREKEKLQQENKTSDENTKEGTNLVKPHDKDEKVKKKKKITIKADTSVFPKGD